MSDDDGFAVWMRETLGISDFFLDRLKTDDDWTFIIKAHSMIEAALSHTIPRFFEDSALYPIFSRLDTSNNKTGKIAFASALGILPKEAIVFIKNFSTMRNLCAHQPKHFEFNIRKYLDQMSEKERYTWANQCAFEKQYPLVEISNQEVRVAQCLNNPRLSLLHSTNIILNYLHCEEIKIDFEELEEIVEFLEKKPTKLRVKRGLHTPPKPTPKK